MEIILILYIFGMFAPLIGGVIYCEFTYGRETNFEKSLQEIIDNYHDSCRQP